MNFLAHLYLSGNSDGVKTGNFIGDYVKGQNYKSYPEPVKKGILLHRAIDSFTDQNLLIKEASQHFRQEFGRYSGIVTDVVFDHFLATHWNEYSEISLRDFARHTHAVLLSNFMLLPTDVKKFLPFMIQHKRLESYATTKGIIKTLEIMANYTSLPAKSMFAAETLESNRDLLYKLFTTFMKGIIQYVCNEHQIEINRNGNY